MKIDIDVNKVMASRIPQNTKPMEQMLQTMQDDSSEFIPRDQDELIASGEIHADSPTTGTFGWYAPHAHYQYKGEVMIGRDSGSAWARSNEPKVYTGRSIHYSTDKNPNAQKEWVEVAREKYGQRWRDQMAKLLGGK